MAMSAGPAESGEDTPMSDINTTPLVDVMLVMLIIFLITVPAIIHTVPLKLPNVTNQATTTKPENVSISIDKSCDVYWSGIDKFSSSQALLDRAVSNLKAAIDKQKAEGKPIEIPEVHIRGDANMEYRCAGKVIFLMQRAGYQKIGFISEPPPRG